MEQLRSYWEVVARRWWLIVALALAGAASGYGFSKLQEPLYRSSARLFVMPARPDHGNTYYSQNVVRQYGQLIASDYFLSHTKDALRLSATVDELRSKVIASGDADRLAIYLTVDDADPQQARAIARQLAQEFEQDQDQRMRNVSADYRVDVRAYDDATPAVLHRPQTSANTLAAGFLGLLLGVVVAFIYDLADGTIKSPDDVTRYMGVAVLGSIPTVS